MKICLACNQKKELDKFNNNKNSKDGKQCYCKICQGQKKREYYAKNREELLKKRNEWRKNNKDKDSASYKRWKEKNPDEYKKSWKNHNINRRKNTLLKISPNLCCNRCGCDKFELLEINHINGGGLKEVGRKNQAFVSKILSGERSVNDLEILCKMCNILHYVQMKFGPQPYTLDWNPE